MKKYCPHCENSGISKGGVTKFSCGSSKISGMDIIRSKQCLESEIDDLKRKLAQTSREVDVWNHSQKAWATTVYNQSKEIENLKVEIKKLTEVKP